MVEGSDTSDSENFLSDESMEQCGNSDAERDADLCLEASSSCVLSTLSNNQELDLIPSFNITIEDVHNYQSGAYSFQMVTDC